jgi:hypothetical protein
MNNKLFAAKRVQDVYGEDPDETIFIPSTCIRGRADPQGKTFMGVIKSNGVLRIDCIENPSFWLEINLSEIPEYKYSPHGDGSKEAELDFNMRVQKQESEK